MQKEQHFNSALITGGSSGIGLAIAEKFASAGMKVAVADIDKAGQISDNIFPFKCDVRKASDVDELYQWVKNKIGIPEVLVLNAGRGIREKLIEGDPEKWQEILETNIMGPLRCIRAFVPEMLERKSGNVIFISSVSANKPHSYGGVYSASKTALEVIAETLRLETLPYINVTVISPGITDTNFFENQISGSGNAADLDMGTISPEEIAEDVFYAICKKSGTSINKIVTRPIAQEF